MAVIKRIASNTVIQVIGKLVVALVGILTLALILSGFGESGQGKYILAIAYAQFIASIADFGLGIYLVRLFSQTKKVSAESQQAIPLRLVSAGIFYGLGAIAVYAFPYDLETSQAIWLALLASLFISINAVLVAYYQSRLKMQIPVGAEVVNRLIVLGLVFLIINFNFPFLNILWAVVIGGAVNLFISWLLLGSDFAITLRPKISVWRRIVSQSLPIWITAILGLIYFRIDTILLSILPMPAGRENLVELASYGTAYKFLEILIAIPGMFLGVVMPLFVRAEKDSGRLTEIFKKAFYAISFFAAPVAIGSFMVAQPLMDLFFPELGEAAVALKILIWAFVFSSLASSFIYLVLGLGKQKFLICPYIAIAVVNVSLNIILIPQLGFRGAAYATILSEFLLFAFGFIIIRRLKLIQGFYSYQALATWLAAGLMGLSLAWLPEELVVRFLAGVVTYLAFAWLLGGLDVVTFKKLIKREE